MINLAMMSMTVKIVVAIVIPISIRPTRTKITNETGRVAFRELLDTLPIRYFELLFLPRTEA